MSYHNSECDKRKLTFSSGEDVPAKTRKSNSSQKLHIEPDRRKKREVANSNERRRMRCINNGFEQLKECIPQAQSMDKMSKANILNHACHYLKHMKEQIRALNQCLQETRCRNCGSCPFFEASDSHVSVHKSHVVDVADPPSRHWYGQDTVDYRFSLLHSPYDKAAKRDHNISTDTDVAVDAQSSEEKPKTPDSDSTSHSAQFRRTTPLSFSHLLQAVEVIHERMDASGRILSSRGGGGLQSPFGSPRGDCSSATDVTTYSASSSGSFPDLPSSMGSAGVVSSSSTCTLVESQQVSLPTSNLLLHHHQQHPHPPQQHLITNASAIRVKTDYAEAMVSLCAATAGVEDEEESSQHQQLEEVSGVQIPTAEAMQLQRKHLQSLPPKLKHKSHAGKSNCLDARHF